MGICSHLSRKADPYGMTTSSPTLDKHRHPVDSMFLVKCVRGGRFEFIAFFGATRPVLGERVAGAVRPLDLGARVALQRCPILPVKTGVLGCVGGLLLFERLADASWIIGGSVLM